MSAVVAHDSLRATGGAAGVEHVQRVGRGDRHAGRRFHARDGVVPLDVASLLQLHLELRSLQNDHLLRLVLRDGNRLVDHRLVRHRPARLETARAAHDRLRTRVLDSRGELVRGESAEDHGVDCAESRAGEHRDHGLRDHRHVDDDAIALPYADAAQRSGEARGLLEQLTVRVLQRLVCDCAVPDERELIGAARLDVDVERVLARVQLPALEPVRAFRVLAIQHAFPRLAPAESARGLAPECLRFLQGPAEDLLITAHGASVGAHCGRATPAKSRPGVCLDALPLEATNLRIVSGRTEAPRGKRDGTGGETNPRNEGDRP